MDIEFESRIVLLTSSLGAFLKHNVDIIILESYIMFFELIMMV